MRRVCTVLYFLHPLAAALEATSDLRALMSAFAALIAI